jgi:hypothetical protein
MKNIVLVMFIIFIIWMITGAYLVNTEHERAQVVVGLGILYLSFIFMPCFIYYRYRGGRYEKYILNDEKLRQAFNQQGKKK